MESYSQVVLFFVHKNEPGGLHACMKAHSANAHQQVIWLRGISNAGGSRWMERRVEFMILEFIGRVLLNVLKAMVWLVLFLLRCVLELAKLTLLVFGLVRSPCKSWVSSTCHKYTTFPWCTLQDNIFLISKQAN